MARIYISIRHASYLTVVQVSWKRRLEDRHYSVYKILVDSTDFMIYEQTPFHPRWYSRKFKGPVFCYEVGIDIGWDNIGWVYGPFPCTAFNELKQFRYSLTKQLISTEKVVADGGYVDKSFSRDEQTGGTVDLRFIRAHHEAATKSKQFKVLGNGFRQSLKHHATCFFAVLNLVKLSIDNREKILFDD